MRAIDVVLSRDIGDKRDGGAPAVGAFAVFFAIGEREAGFWLRRGMRTRSCLWRGGPAEVSEEVFRRSSGPRGGEGGTETPPRTKHPESALGFGVGGCWRHPRP